MSTVLLSRLLIADATLVIYKCNGTSSWRRAMSHQAMNGSTMPWRQERRVYILRRVPLDLPNTIEWAFYPGKCYFWL